MFWFCAIIQIVISLIKHICCPFQEGIFFRLSSNEHEIYPAYDCVGIFTFFEPSVKLGMKFPMNQDNFDIYEFHGHLC